MFLYSKVRLSRLKKSILKKLRNSLRSLLFSIILLIFLSKITLLNEKEGNFKSLKNKENAKSDLDFRIIDEKSKKIKRFDMSVN